MSLSQPTNPPTTNPGTAKPASSGELFGSLVARTQVNQVKGITPNNTIGAGIPKQVSDVKVSVANAQTGATCTVTVLFHRDSTDTSFSGISVWVKGYQGNSQLVQVASGTESPSTFVLNNTGETVSFTIQAYGNGGSAPLSQSPTSSAVLPKSTGGGFGTSTTNYYSVNNPPPPGFSMSGYNVVTPLPVYANPGSGALNGFTIVLKIPASYVQAFTAAGFKVGIVTTNVLGLVVNAASIGKTLPGSTVWTTAPVAFTWPGGAFAAANTLYLSNVCALAGDANHDYYITVYFDPTSAGGNAYATQTASGTTAGWAIYATPTNLSGWVAGNHTADADATGLQTLSGSSLFCIQQVVAA